MSVWGQTDNERSLSSRLSVLGVGCKVSARCQVSAQSVRLSQADVREARHAKAIVRHVIAPLLLLLLEPWSEHHRVDEEPLQGRVHRSIVWIVGKRNHVTLAATSIDDVRAGSLQIERAWPTESAR